jgi:hypothetical protein
MRIYGGMLTRFMPRCTACQSSSACHQHSMVEDGFLTAFLTSVAAAAPSLQVQASADCCCTWCMQPACGNTVICWMTDGTVLAVLLKYCWHCTCLQALRVGGCAARGLIPSGMVGIAAMSRSLRQLALHGLQHVADQCLMAALVQLPMLQVGNVYGSLRHLREPCRTGKYQ